MLETRQLLVHITSRDYNGIRQMFTLASSRYVERQTANIYVHLNVEYLSSLENYLVGDSSEHRHVIPWSCRGRAKMNRQTEQRSESGEERHAIFMNQNRDRAK